MYDGITQQYYLRARFYNPVIGRFTQEDTYYGDGLNLYEYGRNNPVRYIDPSGHEVRAAAEKNYVNRAVDAMNGTADQGVNGMLERVYGGGNGSDILIDIDEMRPKLKTGPDTAFFWSGRTEGIGGAETAANIARENGGVTLESTIEAKNISMPEWDFNNPSTMEAWDLVSDAYAEQVSGKVRAVIGLELREGNIWENVELPRLIDNPKVNNITTIDPKTGIETIIFER